MTALKPALRKDLERVIIKARNLVVADVTDRLKELNVHEGKRGALTDAQAQLRVRLRAHGKQIGDIRNSQSDAQQIDRLVQECAYEQWHRMIFVRFLAENEFLIDPEYGQSVSMEALAEIAEESKTDPWVLAGQFASAALPAIFRKDDPLLELRLSREAQLQLNALLESLPADVFTADDSLGWVYQFWQSEEKDRVNASGDKIDGRSIPAVTQLFTEHYMVLFLLHNTLGAWHAGKVLAENPELAATAADEAALRRAVALKTAGGYEFEYLRFVKVEEASSLLSNTIDHASGSGLGDREVVREEKSQDVSSTFDHTWFDWNEPIDVGSGNLPHVKQEGVTYFVTFRTADSLPAEKWKRWKAERDEWLEKNPKPHTDQQKKEYYATFPVQIEKWLDQRYGALVLAQTAPQKIVDDALHHFNGDRYILDEYVVAANHVHVLVTPIGENDLSDILDSWKSFTANKINELIDQSGKFWQKESFDHAVRSCESLEKFRDYIRAHKTVEEASSLFPKQPEACGSLEPPDFVSEENAEGYSTSGSASKSLEGSSTWRPMGGTFSGWPKSAAELKVLDPSCGSGHFLVAAFELLVRLRMHEEGLSVESAVEAVLRDNLFGLEIDPRCTQIAAFNVAMAVWKLTTNHNPKRERGIHPLPPMRNIACSGIPLGNTRDEWMNALKTLSSPRLASGRDAGGEGLAELGFQWGQLYDMFSKADILGSLINPQRFFGSGMMTDEQLEQISEALATIIVDDRNASDEQQELAAAAQGLTRATELLAGHYTLVITNVPYLGRGKQDDDLKKYLDTQYVLGKADLATAFVLRCLEFCSQGGSTALVTPQNWLFLTTYRKMREALLDRRQWDFVARLGAGAFETIGGHVVNVALLALTANEANDNHRLAGIDVATAKEPTIKAEQLRGDLPVDIAIRLQRLQMKNPDARISFEAIADFALLEKFAISPNGMHGADTMRFRLAIWEISYPSQIWRRFQMTVDSSVMFGGRSYVFYWSENGAIHHANPNARVQGEAAWGKSGVVISLMSNLSATLYDGDAFDIMCSPIVPFERSNVLAIWTYCSSDQFARTVRQIDQKLNVTNSTITKVPFDLKYWQKIAAEKYPNGLPEPESDDPTQWLFHGRPDQSTAPLQVALARLLGYRWPAELDNEMRLSQRARDLVARCGELDELVDDDGIVCIPSVRGEDPATDRLLRLLHATGVDVASSRVQQALGKSQDGSSTLETWLRDKFFQEHCELFHQRPFIWHIWDGKKDGFSALVNYHKLAGPQGKKLLESLTYSYLGDWITRQGAAVKNNESGADDRLLAAKELQDKLQAILHGEPPYDIFVRWKPLHEQPIGWTPDINDGVRMNIRPFMLAELTRGRRGAGVLRFPPKIKWTKDRGKEPERPIEDYPWFWGNVEAASSRLDYLGKSQDGSSTFTGDRWNDLHYSIPVKQAARDAAKNKEAQS